MVLEKPPFITKILPPRRREDVLHRPRLVNFIHEHIERRLLLLSAPAGFGKTTLLADFAHDSDIPVCWYFLDLSDCDPRVFLEYLIAGINYRFPDFGRQTLSLIQSITDVSKDINSIVGSLVNEILAVIPEYFAVVLDDFHCVDSSKPVKEIMDLILRYIPDNCHIIISSRTIPSLTLTRLAAHRQVAGIGITDLRFTPDEIKHLMSQNHRVLLTDRQSEEMASESEGWITGIVLTTHTMWRGLFESIIRAKKASGPVFDYLASEVFDQQSQEVREFLLSSSILATMSPEICDQILERKDSRETLEFLEESNLFISRLEGEERWYRYHHLFQQFLQERLRVELPERFANLHTSAAVLFEKKGNLQAAIEHYFACNLLDEAARIVETAGEEEINFGRFETVEQWLGSLPENVVRRKPRLQVHAGRVAIRNGRLDDAIEFLRVEPELLGNESNWPQAAEILVWRSTALRMRGRIHQAIAASNEALRLAPNVVRIAAAAHQDLGICRCIEGDFAAGIKDLEDSLQLYEVTSDRYKVASLHHDLGEAHVTTGDLKRAASHYAEALVEWERTGNIGLSAFTSNSIGVLYHIQGETSLAVEILESALQRAREVGHLRAETYILASLSDVYRDQANLEEALQTGRQALELARQLDEAALITYCLDALGNIHSLSGEHAKGELMIGQALQLAENRSSNYETGTYKASLGRLYARKGQHEQSISLLSEACSLLEKSQASKELARAFLFRANSLIQLKRYDDAMEDLDCCLELAAKIGYNSFLLASASEVVGLLTYAQKVRNGNLALGQMLDAARAQSKKTRTSSKLKPDIRETRINRVPLTCFAFGQSRVLKGDELVTSSDWAIEKTKEMFFFLALTFPRAYQKEQIIETLWPEIDDSRGNSQFHSTVYRLRRALFPGVLIYENGLYRLDLNNDDRLDVVEFERSIEKAGECRTGSDDALSHLETAIRLYEGSLLEDLYTDWCQDYRSKLEKQYLLALQEVARISETKGDLQAAIRYCRKALSLDYYLEEVHLYIVQLYALEGDRLQAAKHFKQYTEFLKNELGVTPTPQVVARFEQFLFRG